MIDDLFDQLIGALIFFKIDLRYGYHKLRLRMKIFLRQLLRYGHYEYVAMPFGVTSVPTIFMDYMNQIF